MIFQFVVLFTCFAITFVGSRQINNSMLDGRIIGGKNTSIEEHPYQVSMEIADRHVCGGSILSVKRILTAAHCTYEQRARNMKIRAGSTIRGSGGQPFQVAKICQHRKYNTWNFDNDVAVLILKEEIQFGIGTKPVDLFERGEDVKDGTMGTVTGWGAVYEGGLLSRHLQAVEVPRISSELCKKYVGPNRLTEQMICFGYQEGGKDSCRGDSGGPLVIDGKQIGIVSWGYGCAQPGQPGVYSKVAALRDHIDRC